MAFIGSLHQTDPLGADPRFAEDFQEEVSQAEGDDSCVALDFSPDQREELESLISRALAGRLPRGRELKPWEPDKLNARHIQIIMMKAAGMKHSLIAEILGVGDANVSVVTNHPDAQLILNRVLSYAADNATDIQARIKAHSGEMLDTILAVTRDKKTKPETKSSNAFKLLEMAGYGAVEKKEVTNKIEIPEKHAGLLTQAIEESKDITHLSRISVGGPGSEPQGSESAASPPRSGSQDPEGEDS